MNSYLWISGAIQPDTTRRKRPTRHLFLALVILSMVGALTAAALRTGQVLSGDREGSRALSLRAPG
jgi:hypothetical protein